MPAVTVSQAFELALQHHRAGKLENAEALYRQILAVQPQHPEALHMVGAIAHQAGHHQLAVDWIGRAIAARPGNAAAHADLAETYRQMGRFDEAIENYRRAIELRPDFPEAQNNLGLALAQSGRWGEAITAFQRAIELKPDYAEAHFHLGVAWEGKGQLDRAIAGYRRAVEIQPDFAEAQNNLGGLLTGRRQFEEAIACYTRALDARPANAGICYNLANTFAAGGRVDEAIATYRRVIELDRIFVPAYNNLGAALVGQRRFDEAIATFRQAIGIDPNYAEAHGNLGSALRETGLVDEGLAECLQAVRLKPDYPDAHNNQGNAWKDLGQMEEAISAYRRALELKPADSRIHSNLVFALHYHPQENRETILAEQLSWNRKFCEPLRDKVRRHERDHDPNRRLRIGYVSADLRQHVVGNTLLPIFEAHDPNEVECLCYAGPVADPVARRFHDRANGWRNIGNLDDAELAGQIEADGIDILVDLGLHTSRNRLPAFARQPAPIQLSWLGYPGASGVETIGSYLSDRFLDPPEQPAVVSAGQPIRLPDAWCCYPAPNDAPEIGALPALAAGRVTFGSFNNFAKINERVLDVWARILAAVPNSRLLLLAKAPSQQDRTHAALRSHGVAAERVEFLPYLPASSEQSLSPFLARYTAVDIALDTFPYNGMTTTGDALWMAVPVVARRGATPISRASYSLLSNLGCPELVGATEEEYIRIAIDLAGDLSRLAQMRASLRDQMRTSPLTDIPRFTKNLETAYRTLWRQWCENQG